MALIVTGQVCFFYLITIIPQSEFVTVRKWLIPSVFVISSVCD